MADEDRPSRLDSEHVSGEPARELVSRGWGSPEAIRHSSKVDNLFFSPTDPIAVLATWKLPEHFRSSLTVSKSFSFSSLRSGMLYLFLR